MMDQFKLWFSSVLDQLDLSLYILYNPWMKSFIQDIWDLSNFIPCEDNH